MTKGIHIHIKYTIPKCYEKELPLEDSEFDLEENFDGAPLNLSTALANEFYESLVEREENLIRAKKDTIGIQGRYESIELKINTTIIKKWSRKEKFGV